MYVIIGTGYTTTKLYKVVVFFFQIIFWAPRKQVVHSTPRVRSLNTTKWWKARTLPWSCTSAPKDLGTLRFDQWQWPSQWRVCWLWIHENPQDSVIGYSVLGSKICKFSGFFPADQPIRCFFFGSWWNLQDSTIYWCFLGHNVLMLVYVLMIYIDNPQLFTCMCVYIYIYTHVYTCSFSYTHMYSSACAYINVHTSRTYPSSQTYIPLGPGPGRRKPHSRFGFTGRCYRNAAEKFTLLDRQLGGWFWLFPQWEIQWEICRELDEFLG